MNTKQKEDRAMRYGIYFAYWANEWNVDYRPYIEKVARLGFDVLEISCAALPNMTHNQLVELRTLAEDNGISLTAGYGPSASENLGSADPAVVDNATRFYTDILQKLNLLNIPLLGGGVYSYWPVDYSKPIDKPGDWERSVTNVKTVARIAADNGVDYCLEVLNRFEGYLLNTAQEAKTFIAQVDEPNVKIMLDTFHMNIEEDNLIGAIHLAGSDLGHFHVGENNRRLPAAGGLPWQQIGQALHDIGYNRHVVMEPFVLTGGSVGRDIKVWRDMAPGRDEAALDRDAAESVAFLRSTFEDQN